MNTSSRRHFLAVTGAGAAAAGAAALLPASLAEAQQIDGKPDDADFEAQAGSSLNDTVLIAVVTDVSAGELVVMNGPDEITLTDQALTQRIAQLSRKGA